MAIKWLGGKVDHPMSDAGAGASGHRRAAGERCRQGARGNHVLAGFDQSDRRSSSSTSDSRTSICSTAPLRNHLRKLSQDYLAMPRQLKFQENRLWSAIFGFWRQLGDGYLQCLKQHEEGLIGMTIVRKSLPVIVARVVRALTLQLKWKLLRYGPVEPRIWVELAQALLDRRTERLCRRRDRGLPRRTRREHGEARVPHGDDVLRFVARGPAAAAAGDRRARRRRISRLDSGFRPNPMAAPIASIWRRPARRCECSRE